MRRFLLGLAIVAMTATAANATTWVWWQLEQSPDNTPGIDVVQQGKGLQLVINKPTVAPLGYYEFHLGMYFQTDGTGAVGGTTGGMAAHKSAMWRGPSAEGQQMSYFSANPAGDILNPMGWSTSPGYTGGTQNSGDLLIQGWGHARQSGGRVLVSDDGAVKFANFVLRINVGTEQASQWHYIYQTVGTGGFGWQPASPTTLNQVIFGSNAYVYGTVAVSSWATASGTIPVIAIHAIPEPATLALFGLGLIGLIRRR